jgi:Radical SAM superfamily
MANDRLRIVFVTAEDRTRYFNLTLASLRASCDPDDVEVLRVCQPPPAPGANLKNRVARNHIAALRLGAAGPGGFLVCEDDVFFRSGWPAHLRSLDAGVIRTLYVTDGQRKPGLVIDPPSGWGNQAFWWPREEALAFADWFECAIVCSPSYAADCAVRHWIGQSVERNDKPRKLYQCPVDLVEHQQHPIVLPTSCQHRSGTFGKAWPGKPRLSRVEIEITTACNRTCPNCDRSCVQAPSNTHMSLEQVRHFVAESQGLCWLWEEVVLIGGEPTLHPDFLEIVKILKPLVHNRPMYVPGRLIVATNGSNPDIIRRAGGLEVQGQNDIKNYDAFNQAPRDLGMSAAELCWIGDTCGIGLSRHGYYFCGAAAGIDRVFGLGAGVLNLADVGKVMDHTALCGLCGHKHGRKARDLPGMSKSWVDAYAAYRERPPSLPLYGAAAVSGSAATGESTTPAGTV